MRTLEEEIGDTGARMTTESDDFIERVCDREGDMQIVDVAAKMIAEGHTLAAGAVDFLYDAADRRRSFDAEVRANESLSDAVRVAALSPSFRVRHGALRALQYLPIVAREEIVEDAAMTLLATKDIIALSELLTFAPIPRIVDALHASDDWLVRWSLLRWTNLGGDDAFSFRMRRALADDAQPLVAAEAKSHLAILASFEDKAKSTDGWTFGVVSNRHEPSFRGLCARFVAGWPEDKASYTLDELRAFVLEATRRGEN